MNRRVAISALCSLVLALGTIGFASSPPASATTPLTDAQVEAAVAQLDTLVADYLARSKVPGAAVAVVHDDELVYAKGFGVRSVRTGAPVTPETVFQLASVSKPIGASVVAAAVGKRIISWDDPVQQQLPWFTLSDPWVGSHATVGDMYAMRSGLPDSAGDMLELIGFGRGQILTKLRELPLTQFRTTWAYTDFGLTVGAQAVATAAQRPWATLSRELVYTPLGMTSTSSRYADYIAQPNRVELHQKVDGAYAVRTFRNADAQSPSGGVSSNVLDMSKWLRMELANGAFDGRQVVDAQALATANNTQIRRTALNAPAAVPGFYGFGMNIDVDSSHRMRLSHSGGFTAGAGTNVSMLPESNLGIVTLTNAEAGLAEAVNAAFLDLAENGSLTADWFDGYLGIFEAMHADNPMFAPPASPKPARAAADLVGNYANDFYGPATVVATHGKLAVIVGPDRLSIPLTHWSGDRFVALVDKQAAPTKFWVDFGGRSPAATTLNLGISDDPTAMLTRVGTPASRD